MALALLLLGIPARAHAQAYFLVAADLTWEGRYVGEAASLPVTVAWARPTLARVRYEGQAIRLEADVDTRGEGSALMAGVGAPVVLDETGPWRIAARSGTWAPALRGARTGVRVALPAGLPVRRGRIPLGAAPARGTPGLAPWAYEDAHRGPAALPTALASCAALHLAPRPGARRTWQVDVGRVLRAAAPRGGWVAVEAEVQGFVVTGHVRLAAPCANAARPDGPDASAAVVCGDGRTYGRAVRLDAGTPLFARHRGRTPFATLRQPLEALEPLYDPIGQGCTAGTCARFPAEPKGPAGWLIDLHEGDAELLLDVRVETPAEALPDFHPDQHNPGGALGRCRWPVEHWPRS